MMTAIVAGIALIETFTLMTMIFAAVICSQLGDLKAYIMTQISLLQEISRND